MTSVVIVNNGTFVKDAEIASAASAIQGLVQGDFARIWGADAIAAANLPGFVRAGSPENPPSADEWVLGLYVDPDRPGALGYHAKTAPGLPWMKIFPSLAEDEGTDWSVEACHEILEALVDPELSRWARLPDGRTIAVEVCDPVQADVLPRSGPALCDFVTPSYFGLGAGGDGLDLLGLLESPGEVRPGGYNQLLEDGNISIVGAAEGVRRQKRKGSRVWLRKYRNENVVCRGVRRLLRI